MTETVLIVGASGKLGGKIARAMHAKGLRVRLGVRDTLKASPHLATLGELTHADLRDPDSLRQACNGANIVISAVQGGPDVIVDGQSRLLEAAQSQGVQRFIPSDYSLNLFALKPGENWNSDWRRSFDERLMASGQNYSIILNGGFMEVMFSPFIGMVDRQAGTLSFWGDGKTRIDLSSMDDVALFVAEVSQDSTASNRVAQFVGEALSMADIAAAIEQATGQKLNLVSRGTIEDGYATLEQLKAEKADLMRMLPLMYQLPMMSGKAKLNDAADFLYPRTSRTRLVDFLTRQRGE